jgi:hypothetical protein
MKRIFIRASKNIFLFLLLSSFMLISFLPASFGDLLSSEGTKSLFGLESTPAIAEGYDFILVIDESGSMKKNDPANLRKDAAKLFVYLAETLNKGNRVLVSGFGKTTNIYLPLTDISGNEDEISSAIDKIQSSQALTDMKGALDKIKNELDYRTDKKKTVVIFLTDGSLTIEDIPSETEESEQPSRERPKKPSDADGPSAIPDDTADAFKADKPDKNDKNSQDDEPEAAEDAPKRESDYLEMYKKELIDLCRQYSSSGIVIHPIAFTGEAEVDILEQMAEITGGICYKPQEAKDLRVSFIDILRNITSRFIKIEDQQGLPAVTGDFEIGNYIKELVVIGLKNKYTQTPTLQINDPLSSTVSYEQYIEENIFKIAKIINPDPGNWNYQVNGDAIFVFDIVNTALIEPRYSLYAAGAEVPLEIDISGILNGGTEDTAGLPGDILKDFKVTASVQNPDGKNVDAENINDAGAGSDANSSDGIFTGTFASTSEPGYYDINYSITHLPTGAVSNKVISFSIIKYPVKMEVIEPSEPYYQPGSAVDIVIKVENISAAEQTGDENGLIFTADVSSPQGTIAKDLMLLDSGQGADIQAGDGLFSARFTGTASEGKYFVDFFITRPEVAAQAACTGINAEFSVRTSTSADLQIDNNYFTGEPAAVSIDLNSAGLLPNNGSLNDIALSYTLTLPDGTNEKGSLYDDGNIANADKTAGDGIFSALLGGLEKTGRYDIKVEGETVPDNLTGTDDGTDSSQIISINAEGSFYKYYEIKSILEHLDFKEGIFTADFTLTIASQSTDDAKLTTGNVEIKSSENTDAHLGNNSVKAAIKSGGILKAMSDNTVTVEIELDKNIKAGQYSLSIPFTINGSSAKIMLIDITVMQTTSPYMVIMVIGAGIILAAAIVLLIYFLYIRPKRRGY